MVALIGIDRVMELLGLTSKNSLSQPPYKDKIKSLVPGMYSEASVKKYIEEQRARHLFMVEVQRLVMFILDESSDNKSKVAKKLGFPHLQHLENFLEATERSVHTATVAVKCWRNYRELVRAYDKYMGYKE